MLIPPFALSLGMFGLERIHCRSPVEHGKQMTHGIPIATAEVFSTAIQTHLQYKPIVDSCSCPLLHFFLKEKVIEILNYQGHNSHEPDALPRWLLTWLPIRQWDHFLPALYTKIYQHIYFLYLDLNRSSQCNLTLNTPKKSNKHLLEKKWRCPSSIFPLCIRLFDASIYSFVAIDTEETTCPERFQNLAHLMRDTVPSALN